MAPGARAVSIVAATLAPAKLITRAAFTPPVPSDPHPHGGFPASGLTLSRPKRREGMSPPETPENYP
jgi:hypothetical protein